MWIGRNITRDLQNMSGRHHQVETSRIVRCPLLFRLDEFGRVQARSTQVSSIYRVSLLFNLLVDLAPLSRGQQYMSSRLYATMSLFIPSTRRLVLMYWGLPSRGIVFCGTVSYGTRSYGMLQGHARSCGYLFSTALSSRSSCRSPQLPHGQQMGIPGFPLPLVGTMPVDRFPLAGCSRASWFSKPFEHAGPHFHLSSFCRRSVIPVHRAAYPNSIGCWASLARWSHCLGPTYTGATFWAISPRLADPIYAE